MGTKIGFLFHFLSGQHIWVDILPPAFTGIIGVDSLYYIAQLAGSEHWFMISVRRTYTHRTAIHGRRRWFFAMVILDWAGSWCLGLGALCRKTPLSRGK